VNGSIGSRSNRTLDAIVPRACRTDFSVQALGEHFERALELLCRQ